MRTAVLHSHDCLQGRFRNHILALATSRVRSRRNSTDPNPNFNSYACHNRRRRRSPVAANNVDHDRSRSGDRSAKGLGTTNLVVGQVKILKRGEKLSLENSQKTKVDDLDLLLCSTDRLGPDPVMVQKQIRISDPKEGIYAGSAFVTSPPQSSVPVPVFLGRNGAATSGLRRLLRLD